MLLHIEEQDIFSIPCPPCSVRAQKQPDDCGARSEQRGYGTARGWESDDSPWDGELRSDLRVPKRK
jgi:hypothetical protein